MSKPPDHLYRFLDGRFVEDLCKGKLCFTRLLYYILLEAATGDNRIGDRNEGTAESEAHGSFETVVGDEPLIENLKSAGIRIAPGVKGVGIDGPVGRRHTDCFVLSCSAGELSDLVAKVERGTFGEFAYHHCVRLDDPNNIRERLWHFGRIDGRPLAEVFSEVVLAQVKYTRSTHDLQTGPAPSGDPLVKDKLYDEQTEWRFVLIPRTPIESDRVFVECPAATELLFREPVSIQRQSAPPSEFDTRSEEALLEELRALLLAWREDRSADLPPRNPHTYKELLQMRPEERTAAWALTTLQTVDHMQLREREVERRFAARARRLYFEVRRKRGQGIERVDVELASGGSASMVLSVIDTSVFAPHGVGRPAAG